MQSTELQTAIDQLSDVHAMIHKVFMGLPEGSSVTAPVPYYSTSAAASAISNAIDAFYVLRAVLDAEPATDPKGA